MKLLNSFKTSRTSVLVYDAEQTVFNESLYVITSRNLKTDKILIRFATQSQLNQILKTYVSERTFKL